MAERSTAQSGPGSAFHDLCQKSSLDYREHDIHSADRNELESCGFRGPTKALASARVRWLGLKQETLKSASRSIERMHVLDQKINRVSSIGDRRSREGGYIRLICDLCPHVAPTPARSSYARGCIDGWQGCAFFSLVFLSGFRECVGRLGLARK